jgi:hypothetical protein
MQVFRITLIAMLAACGSNNSGTVDAASGLDASTHTPDAPAGSNTITGTVGGTGFTAAMSTYWIGAPDSPTTDTVIYMFDHAVMCSQITTLGWDTGLVAGTQILEMKMVGKTPKAYPTTTAATHIPAAGESLSSYTVAAAGATDMIASNGSVTLTTIGTPAAGQFATGTFHIVFSNGMLDGMYDAPYCAAGREP